MKVGIRVECSVCHRTKNPRGRSAPLQSANGYCHRDTCEGYDAEPFAGSLWPGETEKEFGYPVGTNGVRESRIDECPECGAWVPGIDSTEIFEGSLYECLDGHQLVAGVGEGGRAFLLLPDDDEQDGAP